jgi:predicted AAA+ superfamily ATPase
MQHLLDRTHLLEKVYSGLSESPATVLLGARQTGKTTLAQMIAGKEKEVSYFDLEKASARQALKTPELTLGECRNLVVLDEVQRLPGLFESLRPLCDRSPAPARFLLLGSASPTLMRGVSESLAGRVRLIRVPGFALEEVGAGGQDQLWLRGAFPRAFLAQSDGAAFRWLDDFITIFLERDVPQLGFRVPAEALRRFWTVMAHYHGQVWNGSELGRAMGVSPLTARHYLDILAGAYLMRVLPPWHENLKKRQVKSPKVYLRDSGLLHAILGVSGLPALRGHPRYGGSWEGFALEQVLIHFGETDAYFWSTQRGAELDLVLMGRGRRLGFEFKCSDAPSMTRSMAIALEDLKLDRLFVVYPGRERYRLQEKVEVIPLSALGELPLQSDN